MADETTPGRRHYGPRIINVKRITLRERQTMRELYPEAATLKRPIVRADCIDGPRPCPFVGCRWHLYLDVVEKSGAIRLNYPELEVEDLKESCALDVADRGGLTLDAVGRVLNLTRERVRQIENSATQKLEEQECLLDFARGDIEP